jgi:hypothetical protein
MDKTVSPPEPAAPRQPSHASSDLTVDIRSGAPTCPRRSALRATPAAAPVNLLAGGPALGIDGPDLLTGRYPGRVAAIASTRPRWASDTTSLTPVRPRTVRLRRKASQSAPSSREAMSRPWTSRSPSALTRPPPARTDQGWQPGGSTQRVTGVAACVAPDGSRALLLGQRPAVLDRDGNQRPLTDLESAGTCGQDPAGS